MEMKSKVSKIISGGQTGADRGGLDAAIELGIPHGGWCPKGRKSEDGVIPEKYHLQEMASKDYLKRTLQNILDSDVTAIFTYGEPTGGSFKTMIYCEDHNKIYLRFDLLRWDDSKVVAKLGSVMEKGRGGLIMLGEPIIPENFVLNVAGSRESKAPGIQLRVKNILVLAFSGKVYPMGSE